MITDGKRRYSAVVSGVLLPLGTIVLLIIFASRFSNELRIEAATEIQASTAKVCERVLVFTSQRHGSNAFMEGVNNCKVEKDHRYERTFEFPEYSIERIRSEQLKTYDSFYKFFQKIPKYQYKIMSTVFYQMYYHVSALVDDLVANEDPYAYVLLKRNNSVEVFYSHVDHLRQVRMHDAKASERIQIKDLVAEGSKREDFFVSKWSQDQYEKHTNYFRQFYKDIRTFMAQKQMPLDELSYEDVILNSPIPAEGKEIYLPANNCILKLCSRDVSNSVFVDERSKV